MSTKTKILIWILAAIIISYGWWFWKSQVADGGGVNSYSCNIDSDCVKKEGQCTVECLHKDQEPKYDLDITCKYRPWLEGERCECINSRCTKLSYEDLGLA